MKLRILATLTASIFFDDSVWQQQHPIHRQT